MTAPKVSSGERLFQTYWKMLAPAGLPEPTHDESKPVTGRRWRLDFAWPEAKVGVEVQGGVYGGKRQGHTRPAKYHKDVEKLNACQEHGWVVLWTTPQMLAKDPAQFVGQVARIVKSRLDKKGENDDKS